MRQYTEVIEHYTGYDEAGRLSRSRSQLERVRTHELLTRHLPPAPAQVADIGGAAGAYAFWLAEQGYEVSLLDLTPKHIEQVRAKAEESGVALADIRQGDGRALPYADAAFDVVLLVGPLYHLPEREERLQAWREAYRVLRPGGLVFAAVLSRFSPTLDDVMFHAYPNAKSVGDFTEMVLPNGCWINPPGVDLFTTAYFHLPPEARGEASDAGFTVEHHYAVESFCRYLPNFDAIWEDQAARENMLRLIRLVEEQESLLGASAHQLLVARK